MRHQKALNGDESVPWRFVGRAHFGQVSPRGARL